MQVELKDVLHLYLGCKVVGTCNSSGSIGYLTGVTNGGAECEIQFVLEDGFNVSEEPAFSEAKEVKPILRHISSLTEDEMKDLYHIEYLYGNSCTRDEIRSAKFSVSSFNVIAINWARYRGAGYGAGTDYVYLNQLSPKRFLYLIKLKIDLFGLIEAGFAISETKFSSPINTNSMHQLTGPKEGTQETEQLPEQTSETGNQDQEEFY